MDTELAAIREKKRLKRLEEQIEDMLSYGSVAYNQIIKGLDYNISSDTKLDTVMITKGIMDISGASLAADMEWHFTTVS